jgi:hypothetical protein
MKQTPEEFLKVWMAHVNNCDLDGVLALYADDAVLIPTFSNRLLSTPQKIREYFERLCAREELSIAMHEKTLMIHHAGDEIYLPCGIYCWRFAVDGELLTFEARFSYTLNLALPKPILHHHSSQIPRMI